jgi:hypothetical protein
MGAEVATVVIGGKIVVADHQPRTIDVQGLYREVRAFCAKGLTPEQQAHADSSRRSSPMSRHGTATGTRPWFIG